MVHFNLPLVSRKFIPLCCDKLDVIYILTLNTTNKFIKSKIALHLPVVLDLLLVSKYII